MFEDRIQKGAELLDKIRPGWELKIDLAELELANSCQCVLGQLFGERDRLIFDEYGDIYSGYDVGLAMIWGAHSLETVRQHGFVLVSQDWGVSDNRVRNRDAEAYRQAWAQLDAEWIECIKDRLDRGVTL